MDAPNDPIELYELSIDKATDKVAIEDKNPGRSDGKAWLDQLEEEQHRQLREALERCRLDGKAFLEFNEKDPQHPIQLVSIGDSAAFKVLMIRPRSCRTNIKAKKADLGIHRTSLEHIPFPCYTTNEKLEIQGYNQAFEQYQGVDSSELIGQTTSEAFADELNSDSPSDIDILYTKSKASFETMRIDENSEIQEIKITKSYFEDTRSECANSGLICIIYDQTQQNRDERRMVQLREALDSTMDIFLIIDWKAMRFVDFNLKAEEELGYSKAQLLKLDPSAIFPQISPNQLEEKLEEIANGKDKHGLIQTIIMRADGSVIVSEIHVRPVSNGENNQIVAVARDVSSRIQTQNELTRANRALKILGSINKTITTSDSENQLVEIACEKIKSTGEFSETCAILKKENESRAVLVSCNSETEFDLKSKLEEFDIGDEMLEDFMTLKPEEKLLCRSKPKMVVGAYGLPSWKAPENASVLVLPLHKNDEKEGFLIIFSKDESAFDLGETELLEELAGEIVFGLHNLRQKRARKQAESDIENRLRVESAIALFSSKLLASDNLNSGAKLALPRLLKASGASRTFLYQISHEEKVANKICEFANGNDSYFSQSSARIELETTLSKWTKLLEKNKILDEKGTTISELERDAFQINASQRVIAYSLQSKDKLMGFIGFVLEEERKEWNEANKEMLQIAAQLIGVLFNRGMVDDHMRMLATAINNSDEAVLITNAEGHFLDSRIMLINDGLSRLFGYAEKEIINASPKTLQAEKISESGVEKLTEELAKGKQYTGQVHCQRKDGTSFLAERNVYPIFDNEGTLSNYLCIQRDITEMKKLETRLSFANKMESVGQLSAGIAHEINTPSQFIGDNLRFVQDAWHRLEPLIQSIGGIEGSQNFNLENYSLNSRKLERLLNNVPSAIQDACEGVERITTIVKAMREFSHPEKSFTLSDINKSITTTATVARNEWKYVSEIEYDLEENIPPIEFIPGDINQVILNLLVNAAHAIEEKNEDTQELGQIKIATRHQGESVLISISDSGNGIPEEIYNSIFDPFFTTKEVGKGTGQGLFMAHSIIEVTHDGSLSFESEIGQGTTFNIELPISRKREESNDLN